MVVGVPSTILYSKHEAEAINARQNIISMTAGCSNLVTDIVVHENKLELTVKPDKTNDDIKIRSDVDILSKNR